MLAFLRPLSDWSVPAPGQLLGVLTDIDDTLSTEGEVPAQVVQALAALRAAGLHVIPVTGRPVGWSVPFAQAWPVDAIVAENGAVALLPAEENKGQIGSEPLPSKRRQLSKIYQQGAAVRANASK